MRIALYDMAERPCTFDIVPWIATVDAMAGYEAVHFIVLADRFRDRSPKDKALSPAEKMSRVERVIVPACRLLPGAPVDLVTDPAQAEEWRRRPDTLKPSTFVAETIRQHTAGRDVRRLRAPVPSPHPGAVVITIRQNPAVPEKNCDLGEWLGAASVLMADGHNVALVPDTATAAGPLPGGFNWCREAATDLAVRAALYQEAACSLSMGLGPMAIAMFMRSTRYVVFVDHRNVPDNRVMFERVFGIRWGQQLPFAGDGQVIEYRRDDEDVIVEAFRSTQDRAAA
jgi:hypothetical protein